MIDKEKFPFNILDQNIYSPEENISTCFQDQGGNSYDKRAKAYEWLVSRYFYNKIMWGTSPADYTQFASDAMKRKGMVTLDIGCGGLSQTASIYKNSGEEMVLVDISLSMLKLAKQRLGEKEMPNINLLQADAMRLPFRNDSFQRVVSFGMLHMFNNKSGFLSEALRVLCPGGEFYFSVLTTKRTLSRKYLNFLFKNEEVGLPLSIEEVLNLFSRFALTYTYYTKGSMLFISGQKLQPGV